MSKEALHFMIDVGSEIDKKYSNAQNCSRLKLALNCFSLTLNQKLVNNPTHEFGFSIFGDNQSDDGNNQLLYPIQKPNLDLVRKIKQMSETTLANDKQGGDIFSAIQHIILVFRDYIGKKKYNKRAFLFTTGFGKTIYQESELRNIVANLENDGIKLNIIPIDFMKNYRISQNSAKNEIFATQDQKKNAELLMKLKQFGHQNVQIFPTQIAIQLYSKFRTKDTNPVVLFKGGFQLSPSISLSIATYKCIRKQRLLSLGKYDSSMPFNPLLTKQKQILNDITYVCEGDQSGSIVLPENIIKAYTYGSGLVPVNNIIEPGMRLYEDRNFKLLGFVDRNKVPRESFMGEVEIVVPLDDPDKQLNIVTNKIFTALIHSLRTLKKYGLARYVPRNSKAGVNPRLVALIPHANQNRQMFYLVDLPTVEDVRQFPFNSLKKATPKQQQIVRNLIDKMSLTQVDEDGDQIQYLKTQNTFNPVRQYFFQTAFHRALQNETQIPELDPIIKSYITPEAKIYAQTQQLMEEAKKQFKFVKKQLAKEKAKQAMAIRWSDVLSTNRDTDQYSQNSYQMPMKKFNLDDEKDEQFNPLKPMQSFRDMLTNNRIDLVQKAINSLSSYIQKKTTTASTPQDMQHLIQCCIKLREGCIEQKQQLFWDTWFQALPDKIGKNIPDKLKEKGHGFISSKRNSIYYKTDTITPAAFVAADDLD